MIVCDYLHEIFYYYVLFINFHWNFLIDIASLLFCLRFYFSYREDSYKILDREDRYSRGYNRRSAYRDSKSYRRSRSPYRSSHRSELNDLSSYLKDKMARLQQGLDDTNKINNRRSESSLKRDRYSGEREERLRHHNHHHDDHRVKAKKHHRKHHHHHRDKDHKKSSDELNKSSELSDVEIIVEEEDEEALIERRRQERQKLLENLGYKTNSLPFSSDTEASPKETEEIDLIPEDSLMKTNTKPVFKSESAVFADTVDSSPNGRMSGVQAPAAVAFLQEHSTANLSENAEQPDIGKKFTFDIFSGEVPTAPANGVPGIMDPRAMASENHALVDNWDDAEGYYCEFAEILLLKMCLIDPLLR